MLNNFYHLNYNVDSLDFLVELLLSGGTEKLSSQLVVFPGKRPAVYLRKKLAEKIKKDFLPPLIYSVDELTKAASFSPEPLREINEVEASHLFYEIIKDFSRINPGCSFSAFIDFSHFFYWGIELFQLFEEFFTECVGKKELKILKEAQEFEDSPPETFSLWQDMGKIYEKYQEILTKEKLTTRGFNYFQASGIKPTLPYGGGKIYFAGFYALTKSERFLFKNLFENYEAEYIVQGEDRIDDAFSELSRHFNKEITIKRKNSLEATLFYHPASSIQNEMAYLREEFSKEKALSECAVILPRAESLFPFLWEVAEYIDADYNISLQYPLRRSPFFNLVELLIQLQETRRDGSYFLDNFISVLNHPYTKSVKLDGADASYTRMLIHQITGAMKEARRAFFSLGQLNEFLHKVNIFEKVILQAEERDSSFSLDSGNLEKLWEGICRNFVVNFEDVKSLEELFEKFQDLIYFLAQHGDGMNYYLAPEFWQKFVQVFLKYQKGSLIRYEVKKKDDPVNLFNVFRYLMSREKVNFTGLPLKGLQVLGPLETRNIRFKKIFYLDMNEGVLPSVRKYEPLITPSLRGALGLPTYRDREKIYKHYIRSAISSSEEAHLFFLTGGDLVKSRFLEELVWEGEKKKETLAGGFQLHRFHHKLSPAGELAINKTAEDILKLKARHFSPSSIDTYLNCPLEFYFKYVAELKEEETFEIDAKNVGLIAHEILENLIPAGYWTQDGLSAARDRLSQVIDSVFEKYFPDIEGEILIVKKLLKRRLYKFLDNEKNIVPVHIIGTEKELTGTLKFNSTDIFLKGKVDRIEKRGDKFRVVDYKTGNFEKPDMREILDLGSPVKERSRMLELIGSFQLPLYLYLAQGLCGKPFPYLDARLISIKEGRVFSLFEVSGGERLSDKEIEKAMQLIFDSLFNLIFEIFNKALPFKNDNRDEKKCGGCSYRFLCL